MALRTVASSNAPACFPVRVRKSGLGHPRLAIILTGRVPSEADPTVPEPCAGPEDAGRAGIFRFRNALSRVSERVLTTKVPPPN